MNAKPKLKMLTDLCMTIAMLAMMSYSLISEATHEWVGIGLFALFILHHILNWGWVKSLPKGRYTAFRVLQTGLVLLVCAAMLGCMVSGIVLSREVFAFLGIASGTAWARIVHLLCSYWGFAFLAIHLGLHWNAMLAALKRAAPRLVGLGGWPLRVCGWSIAGYGVFALFKRELHLYMSLQSTFVFFDYGEPQVFFFLDYIAILGLFILAGFYLGRLAQRRSARTPLSKIPPRN